MKKLTFVQHFNNNRRFSNITFSKKKKKNTVKGVAFLGGAGIVGQQTARSGIPRLLGVRLESHSTSKKAAKEIIKGGGFLDPNKGGGGVTKDLVTNNLNSENTILGNNFFDKDKEFLKRAKNNVFITGKHINYDPTNNNAGRLKEAYRNIVGENVYRKFQRAFYRGQSEMPMDKEAIEKIVKAYQKLPENQNALDRNKENIKWALKNLKQLRETGTKEIVYPGILGDINNPERRYTEKDLKDSIKNDQKWIKDSNSGTTKRFIVTKEMIEARKPEAVKKGLTGAGKSLYIGGSDDYFNKNFIPDPDDVYAMKTSNKIKVHGNRASATLEALKREGDGNRLKGAVRLIKANPKRVLAGAGILTIGGLATTKLGEAAYSNLTGKVKSHRRKNKSGKWSTVRSFVRDRLKKR